MVEHAVEMACSYMPETVADKCIDFVQEYGDEVIDLIIKAEANPELVCSLMTLCEVQKTWGKYKAFIIGTYVVLLDLLELSKDSI